MSNDPLEPQPHALPLAADTQTESRTRALSLDALRGLAVLGMVLSGFVPYWNNTLPAWMYHAQLPPPAHTFDPGIVGMTWVDFVFPLFLFSMGAAIPLALSRRLQSGTGKFALAASAFSRGLFLLAFALFEQNLAPGLLLEKHGQMAWVIGILGFLSLFAMFSRLPEGWSYWPRFLVRVGAGCLPAAALLAFVRFADGSGFSVHRHDIIIVILANVAVTTSLIWLWSPHRYTGRLCIMGLVITAHLARRYAPWGSAYTDMHFLHSLLGERILNGLIWACDPTYQKYLLVTIPGTIVGDVLVTWLRPAAQRLSFSIQNSRWGQLSVFRCVCLALVCLSLVVLGISGLSMNDWQLTSFASGTLGSAGFLLLYGPAGRNRMKVSSARSGRPKVSAQLFRAFFGWGMLWLLLGLALYPYQGGIRKDPASLSYLFITAGLAHFCLVFLAVFTEALHRPATLFLLITNGQNPLIAYVAGGMFIMPLLHLIPAGNGLSALDWMMTFALTPWGGFGRAVALTLVVAMFVSVLTRLRVFWRI